jgi:hypothetical protein
MRNIKMKVVVVSLLTVAMNAAAASTVAALMPCEGKFLIVLEEMRKQAGNDYAIRVIDMNNSPKIQDIACTCKAQGVQALVLMDSKAIKAALELEKFDSSFKSLPKFAIMTLMVESTSRGLSNVAGIKFEVPFYTVVTNFRIISQKDFTKVGIFYRNSFTGIIEESKKYLGREGISICQACVDCASKNKVGPEDVLKTMNALMDHMVREEKIDVFLLPADNLIVNSRSLGAFWINNVKKIKIPAIAPLDMLANEKLGVAVFAADPDLLQLGSQAMAQIVEHFENGTPADKIGFEPTISIKSTLNMRVAREIGWKLKEDKLGRITTIIK